MNPDEKIELAIGLLLTGQQVVAVKCGGGDTVTIDAAGAREMAATLVRYAAHIEAFEAAPAESVH